MTSTSGLAKFAPAALVVVVGCFLIGWSLLSMPKNSVDDWRRTAQGWEWMPGTASAFERPAIAEVDLNVKRIRVDTHPAVLALFQLVATFLALSAFRHGRTQSVGNIREWTVVVGRSFRASAFGS